MRKFLAESALRLGECLLSGLGKAWPKPPAGLVICGRFHWMCRGGWHVRGAPGMPPQIESNVMPDLRARQQ